MESGRFWAWISRIVMARPVTSIIIVSAAMLASMAAWLVSAMFASVAFIPAMGTQSSQRLMVFVAGCSALLLLVLANLSSQSARTKTRRMLAQARDVLYLGRGPDYPLALEGALKLKEISYIHAEGYASGEMKHGPIALIDEGMPVVALAPRDGSYDRIMGNLEEVRARDGRVIAFGHEGDRELRKKSDAFIEVPAAADLLAPILMVIPLQLLAYHVAVRLGRDVDQPRNLAKSVTVE